MNTTQWTRPGPKPRPHDLESSMLTIRPPCRPTHKACFVLIFMPLQCIQRFVTLIPRLYIMFCAYYYDNEVLPIGMFYSFMYIKFFRWKISSKKTKPFFEIAKFLAVVSPLKITHQRNILNQHNFPVFFSEHLLKASYKKSTLQTLYS